MNERAPLRSLLPPPAELDELTEAELLRALVVWAAELSVRLDQLDPHQPGGGPGLLGALVGGVLRRG